MKFAIIALLCLVAYAAASPESYTANLRRQSIVDQINSDPSSTWTAEVSPYFLNATDAYVRRILGARQGGPILPAVSYTAAEINAAPEEWDGRTAFPDCPSFKEVRDQSACGSCWAFGAAEAATDRWCVATQGKQTPHFSATDLLSCCGWGCGSGCNGGYPSAAWGWLASTGIVTGGNYNDFSSCYSYPMLNCEHHTTGSFPPCSNYDFPTPACQKSCDAQSTYTTPYSKDKHFFKSPYSVIGEENMKADLMKYGSIEVAFSVYEDFVNYKSGIYSHKTGSYLGGHAVKLIGWGVENGKKYWTIANSWNEHWGEGGFFRIARGNNECGLEASGVAGLPNVK